MSVRCQQRNPKQANNGFDSPTSTSCPVLIFHILYYKICVCVCVNRCLMEANLLVDGIYYLKGAKSSSLPLH